MPHLQASTNVRQQHWFACYRQAGEDAKMLLMMLSQAGMTAPAFWRCSACLRICSKLCSVRDRCLTHVKHSESIGVVRSANVGILPREKRRPRGEAGRRRWPTAGAPGPGGPPPARSPGGAAAASRLLRPSAAPSSTSPSCSPSRPAQEALLHCQCWVHCDNRQQLLDCPHFREVWAAIVDHTLRADATAAAES